MDSRISGSASQLRDTGAELGQVPIVPTGTVLVDLAQVFARHETQHVLVQESSGGLLGIVSAEELQNAMRTASETELTAWHHRTVESLISVTLEIEETSPQPRPADNRKPTTELDCVSIRDGADLLALMTNEDVLLSWNRLEPALARAATDALTSLPNRAHFERRFQEEWQRASRLGLTLGLLIIDVDHFKQVNDTFGHLRGDMVLAAVAQCCQKQLRSYDLVARFAGDEFVAVTCGCSLEDIDLPIRRLQESIRSLDLRFNDEHVPTSLSIGASVVCSGLDQLNADDLLESADQCLYRAKRSGRNRAYRVELFGDGTSGTPTRVDAVPQSVE
ncbi:MAG: GGDEF domain-containing protein [Planctomycetales bacterium]|jgi:diguanylate cyclase (GGDEF)-like protein